MMRILKQVSKYGRKGQMCFQGRFGDNTFAFSPLCFVLHLSSSAISFKLALPSSLCIDHGSKGKCLSLVGGERGDLVSDWLIEMDVHIGTSWKWVEFYFCSCSSLSRTIMAFGKRSMCKNFLPSRILKFLFQLSYSEVKWSGCPARWCPVRFNEIIWEDRM